MTTASSRLRYLLHIDEHRLQMILTEAYRDFVNYGPQHSINEPVRVYKTRITLPPHGSVFEAINLIDSYKRISAELDLALAALAMRRKGWLNVVIGDDT